MKRVVALSLAVAVSGLAARSIAALPVWGGPVFTDAGGGVDGQSQSSLEGVNGISDAGVAIGNGSHYSVGGNWMGSTGFRFTQTTSSLLNDLGTDPAGATLGAVYSISRYGLAVGNRQQFDAAHNAQGNVAIRYPAASNVATLLGNLGTASDGSTTSLALDINDSGVSAGSCLKYTAAHTGLGYRAVLWPANQVTPIEMQVLGTNATGGTFASTYAVNNNNVSTGRVTKYVNNVSTGDRAVRWNPGGGITELGVTSSNNGITDAEGHDINDAGAIIGSCVRYAANGSNLGERAVLWQANSTVAVELGTLGVSADNKTLSHANHISNAGTIVGSASKYDAQGNLLGGRAVKWSTANTNAVELPMLHAGSGYNEAVGVNNMDYIVGMSQAANSQLHAVMWAPGGAIIDLNTLIDPASGYTLRYGKSISETGFVTGEAIYDPDGAGGESAHDRVFTMLVPKAGTYGKGDVNFDRVVNFDDLLTIAQHYGQANATKRVDVADVNLDGLVNFDDLLTLAQNYGAGAVVGGNTFDSAFAADWALARSMTPEPCSLLACIGSAIALRRKR